MKRVKMPQSGSRFTSRQTAVQVDLGHFVRLSICATTVLALVVLAASTASAHDVTVDEVETDVAEAKQEIAEMTAKLGRVSAALDEDFALERRLQDGQIMLEIGDPERAAVFFLDITSRPEWSDKAGFKEAEFLLGEALFQSGHFIGAREQFLAVLDHGRPEHTQQALARLIETGVETGEWDVVDKVYRRYEQSLGGRIEPGLLYSRGKGLYARGDYAAAVKTLGRVPMDDELGLKARYHAGVARVRLGRLGEAMGDFVSVIEQAENFDSFEAKDVRELAWLARARIHYERGEWSEAIDSYQEVPRDSRHFDQALYEITWTHVRQEEPELALRNIDILMMVRPDSLFIPEAQRLRGDLLKAGGDFDQALDTYETILERFEPVVAEMDAMVEGHPDRVAYFRDLVSEDDFRRTQYLPRSAAELVRPDEDMREATSMVRALGDSVDNMEEARDLVTEIETAIESDSRYELFPDVRAAWISAQDLDSQVLEARRDLNILETEHLDISAESDAVTQRIEAEKAFRQLPQSREDYFERERALGLAFEERKQRAFRLQSSLEGAEARISTMERWLIVEAPRSGISPEQELALRDQLEAARTELETLEDDLRELRRELRILSALGGIDANQLAREAEVRKAYRLALLRERDWLAAQRSGNDAELQRIDRLRTALRETEADLDAYRGQIVTVVDAKVEEIRVQLDAEKTRLGEYEVRFDDQQEKVRLVAGEIAHNHWERVRGLFSDLVLAADVGVVDVAWQRKDTRSREVDELIEARNKEREILEQDFEQVLRELGESSGK